MSKTTFVFLIGAMCFLLVTQCDDSNPAGYIKSDLVGKWIMKNIDEKGTINIKIPNVMDSTQHIDTVLETFTNDDDYFLFRADNKYIVSTNESHIYKLYSFPFSENTDRIRPQYHADVDSGTWSISNKTLTMKSQIEDSTILFEVTLSGPKLMLTVSQDTVITQSGATITCNIDLNIHCEKQ